MGVFGRRSLRLARSLRAQRGARLRSLTPDSDSWQASPAKKARVEQNEQATPPSSPLSAEQLIRIQRNKAAALLRLAARNVPAGLGESWKQQLCGEFGKPYFIKVGGRGASLLLFPPFRFSEKEGVWRSQDNLGKNLTLTWVGGLNRVGGLGASWLRSFFVSHQVFPPGNPGVENHQPE